MSFEENKKLGYVLYYRSKLEWQWYKFPTTAHLFDYCIHRANYKDNYYGNVLVKKGSFLTSLNNLHNETGLTVQEVRTSLKRLASTNDLTYETTNKGTVITVVNYSVYQSQSENVTSTLTNQQQTNNKRITNQQQLINKENKVNKVNNVVVSDDTPTTTTIFDDDFVRFWKAYQKKGSKKDTYEVWKEHEFDEEEIDLVIFAAKEYSKENASDRTSMMYSRTFLENEIYLDYQDKFKKYKVYLKEQEELDEIRKKLKMKDGYEW